MNQAERDDLLGRLDERTLSICQSLDTLREDIDSEESARLGCRVSMDKRVRAIEVNSIETKAKIRLLIAGVAFAAALMGAFLGELFYKMFAKG